MFLCFISGTVCALYAIFCVSDPESSFVIFSDRRFPLANIPDFRVRIGTHEAVRYPFFRYKCVCLFIALAMPAFFSCLYMMVDRYHACRGYIFWDLRNKTVFIGKSFLPVVLYCFVQPLPAVLWTIPCFSPSFCTISTGG